jgi:hypothetical protein
MVIMTIAHWQPNFKGLHNARDSSYTDGWPNEIVEAVRLAIQCEVAAENSYRSSVVKALDGPAA